MEAQQTPPLSSHSRQEYRFILAPLGLYLTRMPQVACGELPARWAHLAIRTIQQRPIQTYSAYLEENGMLTQQLSDKKNNIQTIDTLVGAINNLFNGETSEAVLRNVEGEAYKKIKDAYETIRKLTN